jgi:pimeloyl-ACP methyl ester carboxylesterase
MKADTVADLDGIPIEHHFMEVNGIRMHYVAAGSGPLVVLLHGFPEFWWGWRKQIPVLARHFRVIAPDLRGYGQSDKPPQVKAYTMQQLRTDIQDLIRGLGQQKCRIVAHDWGGAIGWDLVIRKPEFVERIALLNIPHPALLNKALRKSPRQLLRSWYFFYFQLPWIPELGFRLMMRKLVKNTFQGWAHQPNAFTEEDLEMYRENMQRPGALRAMLNYYRAIFRNGRSSSQGIERPIEVPVRMIWGENDKALGKNLTTGTEEYMKGPFDIHYLPDCSHWVMSEYPDRVNELLLEFLQTDFSETPITPLSV